MDRPQLALVVGEGGPRRFAFPRGLWRRPVFVRFALGGKVRATCGKSDRGSLWGALDGDASTGSSFASLRERRGWVGSSPRGWRGFAFPRGLRSRSAFEFCSRGKTLCTDLAGKYGQVPKVVPCGVRWSDMPPRRLFRVSNTDVNGLATTHAGG